MKPHLLLVRSSRRQPAAKPGTVVKPWQEILLEIHSRKPWLFRYASVTLLTQNWHALSKPLATAVLLRLLTWGNCEWQQEQGPARRIDGRLILRLTANWLWDALSQAALRKRLTARLRHLRHSERRRRHLDLAQQIVYLKTDLQLGLTAGGSVAHATGVLLALARMGHQVLLFAADELPLHHARFCLLPVDGRYQDFPEWPNLAFNETGITTVCTRLKEQPPAFFYHRYGLHSLAGAELASRYQVPLVLEYNGSEVWVARHWGARLTQPSLAEEIERVNLDCADLIVVVSQPLKDTLVSQGIEPAKILVNPNGVDPDRYTPLVDGAAVRKQWGLTGHPVIGFLGSFGPWHGASVLVEAFAKVLQTHTDARLLLVGDGVEMAKVKAAINHPHIAHAAIVTGSVPQEEGPAHLAACDILVSPHVPNPDGSPFFGSPTKLFEYMAMGKAIVASRLGQIADVLEHGRTAWLVEPGNADDLAQGLVHLLENPELCERLGEAARKQVLLHHTWEQHTRRILDKLQELCG